MTGIYKITNLINGHAYVGQAKDIERRWAQEKNMSKNQNNPGYNYPLMKAFRKYGIENFKFEIIEECDINDLNNREIYWIEFYNTFFNGYNQTLGGDTTSQQPKEKILGIINDLLNTDIIHKEIAEKWNISTEMVQGINTGRYWKHSADYPLQKQHKRREYANQRIHFCIKCGKKKSNKGSLCLECYNKEKSSNILDKNKLYGELCECNGNFTMVSKKHGVSDNAIRKWCIKYNLPYHSSDYKENVIKEKIRDFKISVRQIDKRTRIIINVFESISDACRYLGIDVKCGTHISAVLNGNRKTAYGYKWEKNE